MLWIMSKVILPLFCFCSDAFIGGSMRRTSIICCGIVVCSVSMGLLENLTWLVWCLGQGWLLVVGGGAFDHPLRGKILWQDSFLAVCCWIFDWKRKIEYSERLRDQVRMFGRWLGLISSFGPWSVGLFLTMILVLSFGLKSFPIIRLDSFCSECFFFFFFFFQYDLVSFHFFSRKAWFT